MRYVIFLFVCACAGTPETASYQALNGKTASTLSFPDIIASLDDCSSCACVQQAWADGADLLAAPYPAYPAVYGSAYPPYAYAGPYLAEYNGYDGFSFCASAGYGGYYGGYQSYSGSNGCDALSTYVNALVQADAKNGCDLFDKP